MSRPSISRRVKLALATGTALLLAWAVPTAAYPAAGDVQVVLGQPGEDSILLAPRLVVKSPQDGHCYTVLELFPNAPEGNYFRSVANYTIRPVSVYESGNCTGTPYGGSALSYAIGVSGAPLHSFRIG
ncbi:hypothetical protein [Streptomyces sp. NPDC059378]|uniref:hypothetical protein n=1 Tax=Streptomyces sp. NPDC059378 TaxID=3346815 RepID=UPI0036BA72EB